MAHTQSTRSSVFLAGLAALSFWALSGNLQAALTAANATLSSFSCSPGVFSGSVTTYDNSSVNNQTNGDLGQATQAQEQGGPLSACQYPALSLPGGTTQATQYYAAMEQDLFTGFDLCGACCLITNPANGQSVTVVVTDECPVSGNPPCANGNNHIDLSYNAISKINGGGTNYSFNVNWHVVPCPLNYFTTTNSSGTSNITYSFKGGASSGWATLIIRDYEMPIQKVSYCTGNGSGCMPATWQTAYNGWVPSGGPWNTFYLQITDDGGNVGNFGPISCCSPTSSSSTGPVNSDAVSIWGNAGGQMPACGAASPTYSPSPVPSKTSTPSQTRTVTPAIPTATSTGTRTGTPTATATGTPTASRTASPSPSGTATRTASATVTVSGTPTASPSPSPTRTASGTVTGSPSVSPSRTASLTPSPLPTATASRTASATSTDSPSATATPTISATPTPSLTFSAGPTLTGSRTGTPSPSASPSATGSSTATISATSTPTLTFSVGPTLTGSQTHTISPSPSPSQTITASFTPSPAFSATVTGSLTVSPTLSPAFSATATVTLTASPTRPPTFSATATVTATPSVTPTATPTVSPAPGQATVISVGPATAPEQGGALLTITGTGFMAGAVVLWNGQALGTTFVSSTELQATSPVAVAGTYTVTVDDPGGQAALGSAMIQVVKATGGPLVIDDSRAYPDPLQGGAQGWVSVKLEGPADRVTLRVYTVAMVCVGSTRSGPLPQGWAAVALPAGTGSLPSGLYYYELGAERGSASAARPSIGRLVVLH